MRWWSRSKDYIYMLWWVYVWISVLVTYFSGQSKPAWHLFDIDISGFIVINALVMAVFFLFFMPYYIASSLWPLVVSLVRRVRRTTHPPRANANRSSARGVDR